MCSLKSFLGLWGMLSLLFLEGTSFSPSFHHRSNTASSSIHRQLSVAWQQHQPPPIHADSLSLAATTSTTTEISRRKLVAKTGAALFVGLWTATIATIGTTPLAAHARLESVNRPDLLPTERNLNVIQTEKILTSGQVKRMDQLLGALERDTGFRVKVLCQNYPNTPGLAIRDYWDLGKEGQKDDKYVVLVVDQFGGRGNVLNFNVGDGVKLALPNIFWTRLQAQYGTTFYVRDNGMDTAVVNAIDAIATCLRSEEYCVNVPDATPSMKSLGLFG